ncbi:hypothetical protein JHK82_056503 [Glycine max]|uniref:Uncharacterized protein n=2 Tax=Glycine subgen. Soja TaxID=1462606 RepID=K7N3L5_SOYBN|nr:hypothetical protein JHK82_056503 [Glycine max]KAH1036249.1 hypothetical protein GYH30_055963 [Glycine max]KRG91420.1 hypothetical protein GLYMA_20G153800v4 [Glycine max]RZB44058.1 hypothetical protein D0Y65_054206 [Glycine soja]
MKRRVSRMNCHPYAQPSFSLRLQSLFEDPQDLTLLIWPDGDLYKSPTTQSGRDLIFGIKFYS